VAHAYNPRYSRGQEDRCSKPTQANNWRDPYLKTTHHKKRTGEVAQGVGPEFKPWYSKKKKKKKNKHFYCIRLLTKHFDSVINK
jgi:hypothetical protein